MQLLVPLVVADIVDFGIAAGDAVSIVGDAVELAFIALAGLVVAVTAQYFSAKLSAGFGTALRGDLLGHILSLSRGDLDRLGASTLTARMTSDSQQIQDGVNMFFRLVLRSPLVVFGSMVLSYVVDGVEGVVFTATVAALAVIVVGIMRAAVTRFRDVQRRLDGVLAKTREQLEGVRVLRAFRREQAERDAFSRAAGDLMRAQVRAGDLSALVNPLTYMAMNAGLVVILYVGGVRVGAGDMSQGDAVALVNYSAQMVVELIKMANLVVMLSRASACAARVNEVFATKNTMADGVEDPARDGAAPTIEFDDVSFSYPGASGCALSHVSFSAAAGETLGVIGGTGSGKSTLASLLMRFYDVSEGAVLVGGVDVRRWRKASLRRFAGIVEQHPRLFSGTVAENLEWGDESACEDDLRAALRTAQAADVVASRPEGLSAAVEQGGANFSGGQRQRLAIARTLVRRPRILVLDDSTSALDYATDAALRAAVRRDFADATLVVVSQRIRSICDADKILVLDGGRLSAAGTHEELLATSALYREIFESQEGAAPALPSDARSGEGSR